MRRGLHCMLLEDVSVEFHMVVKGQDCGLLCCDVG